MNDKTRCKFIEDFANDTSIAKGGNIKITYDSHCTHYEPKMGYTGFKFEDGQYLGHLVDGASAFMFWLLRKGYKITKPKQGAHYDKRKGAKQGRQY